MLWGDERGAICIGNSWGPAVPYRPVSHGDGHYNHGYFALKGEPEAARRVPEAFGWPELQELLIVINATTSPIESAGCEKGYFPGNIPGGPTVKLGSYLSLLFSQAALNDAPENALLLAAHLFTGLEGCQQWWSNIEIELERFPFISGTIKPWGLLVRVIAFGNSEEQARRLWGVSLDRLSNAVKKLPQDSRWRSPSMEGNAP